MGRRREEGVNLEIKAQNTTSLRVRLINKETNKQTNMMREKKKSK